MVNELESYISVMQQTIERVAERTEQDVYPLLSSDHRAIEEEATWLMHGWNQMKEEAAQLAELAAELSLGINDHTFENAMMQDGMRIEDKDQAKAEREHSRSRRKF
jgi:hypothetical protein